MNFQTVIEENFGHKKLVDLIMMVHEQNITVANAKLVMMAIIDTKLNQHLITSGITIMV